MEAKNEKGCNFSGCCWAVGFLWRYEMTTTELALAFNALTVTYKKVKDFIDKVSDLEIKRIIVDMGGQIIDLEMAAKEYQLKISELEDELRQLKAVPEKELVYDNGVYRDKDGKVYCPTCYDNDKKLIHMTKDILMYSYYCNKCEYGIK